MGNRRNKVALTHFNTPTSGESLLKQIVHSACVGGAEVFWNEVCSISPLPRHRRGIFKKCRVAYRFRFHRLIFSLPVYEHHSNALSSVKLNSLPPRNHKANAEVSKWTIQLSSFLVTTGKEQSRWKSMYCTYVRRGQLLLPTLVKCFVWVEVYKNLAVVDCEHGFDIVFRANKSCKVVPQAACCWTLVLWKTSWTVSAMLER